MKPDISQIIYNSTDLDQAQADDLAGLIADWVDGLRCEWTLVGNETGHDFHKTSCGHTPSVWYPQKMAPYCPFCGKRISIKEC